MSGSIPAPHLSRSLERADDVGVRSHAEVDASDKDDSQIHASGSSSEDEFNRKIEVSPTNHGLHAPIHQTYPSSGRLRRRHGPPSQVFHRARRASYH